MKTGLGFIGGLAAIVTDLFAGGDRLPWIISALVVAAIAALVVAAIAGIYLVGIQTIVNIIVLVAALVFALRWIMS